MRAVLFAACTACADAPAPSPDVRDTARDTATPLEVADPALVQACDSLEQWTRAAATKPVRREDGRFIGVRGVQRWGCRVVLADTLAPELAERPLDVVQRTLAARGWQHEQDYAADSSEGAMLGMRSGTLVCVLQHYWQSHSDDERAAQPTEPYRYDLELECFREAQRSAS